MKQIELGVAPPTAPRAVSALGADRKHLNFWDECYIGRPVGVLWHDGSTRAGKISSVDEYAEVIEVCLDDGTGHLEVQSPKALEPL